MSPYFNTFYLQIFNIKVVFLINIRKSSYYQLQGQVSILKNVIKSVKWDVMLMLFWCYQAWKLTSPQKVCNTSLLSWDRVCLSFLVHLYIQARSPSRWIFIKMYFTAHLCISLCWTSGCLSLISKQSFLLSQALNSSIWGGNWEAFGW